MELIAEIMTFSLLKSIFFSLYQYIFDDLNIMFTSFKSNFTNKLEYN